MQTQWKQVCQFFNVLNVTKVQLQQYGCTRCQIRPRDKIRLIYWTSKVWLHYTSNQAPEWNLAVFISGHGRFYMQLNSNSEDSHNCSFRLIFLIAFVSAGCNQKNWWKKSTTIAFIEQKKHYCLTTIFQQTIIHRHVAKLTNEFFL